MDFLDTPEQAAFRQDVVRWLDATLPKAPPLGAATQTEREARNLWWQQQLAEGGYAGITWPVEYGGRALPGDCQAIFDEEAGRRHAPVPANVLGMILAGPTILTHGTPEQKERYLPKILSGEEIWCQGFSEPGAGSDLAAVRTTAQRTENGWVVNGQKVWTSFAHLAQRCMLLARTEPGSSRQAGLTYFCATMDDVEVRPLRMVNEDTDFNEVFFSDMLVDEADRLGEEGDGWRVAITTLAFERMSIPSTFRVEAELALDRLAELVRSSGEADDPYLLDRLGAFACEVDALRVGGQRLLAQDEVGPEGSLMKLTWAHAMQGMTRFALELGGREGVLDDRPDARYWSRAYLRARGNSVEGGTDEIQRSIIAERLLGLPRSR